MNKNEFTQMDFEICSWAVSQCGSLQKLWPMSKVEETRNKIKVMLRAFRMDQLYPEPYKSALKNLYRYNSFYRILGIPSVESLWRDNSSWQWVMKYRHLRQFDGAYKDKPHNSYWGYHTVWATMAPHPQSKRSRKRLARKHRKMEAQKQPYSKFIRVKK